MLRDQALDLIRRLRRQHVNDLAATARPRKQRGIDGTLRINRIRMRITVREHRDRKPGTVTNRRGGAVPVVGPAELRALHTGQLRRAVVLREATRRRVPRAPCHAAVAQLPDRA